MFAQGMAKLAAVRSEFDKCLGGPGITDGAAIDKYYATAQSILSGEATPDEAADSTAAGATGGTAGGTGGRGMGGAAGGNAGAATETASASVDPDQIVYGRKRVRDPDRGPASTSTTRVQQTFNGFTITYDTAMIYENT